jgi:tRNA (cmo5U34)-methyltransferase
MGAEEQVECPAVSRPRDLEANGFVEIWGVVLATQPHLLEAGAQLDPAAAARAQPEPAQVETSLLSRADSRHPNEVTLAPQFHNEPETYLQRISDALPGYAELQERSIAAIPFPPGRVLELGIGTGETTQRLLTAHPQAEVTGLDASPEMVFRARELGIDVQLARMEDPLPDGPWDLVIAVLATHHLNPEQKKHLFRRVREQSRSLVLGDQVAAANHVLEPEPGVDFLDSAQDLADWSGGEIVWQQDDLAVVRAIY